MHKRRVQSEFEVKEMYTISDIVAYTRGSLSRQQVLRIITAAQVNFLRVGRSLYIPIDEMQLKLPKLWDALQTGKVSRDE